jgi:hypothetical protein
VRPEHSNRMALLMCTDEPANVIAMASASLTTRALNRTQPPFLVDK